MLFSPKNKKIAAWKVVTALIDRKEHAPPFPHVQSYLERPSDFPPEVSKDTLDPGDRSHG